MFDKRKQISVYLFVGNEEVSPSSGLSDLASVPLDMEAVQA